MGGFEEGDVINPDKACNADTGIYELESNTLGLGVTHIPPIKKMPDSKIFCALFICRFHKIGIGTNRMSTSVAIFTTDWVIKNG